MLCPFEVALDFQKRYQSLFDYEWYANFRVRKSADIKFCVKNFGINNMY